MGKFLNSNDPNFVKFLQECEIPSPRFYIKRDSLKEQDFVEMSKGTTWEVLSDPVGDISPLRKFVFCKCNKCGFRRNVRFADLRSNSTACENCLQEKYKIDAAAAGCEYLGRSNISTWYGVYKINKCGHILDIRRDGVKLGKFRCKYCFLESISSACEGTSFVPILDSVPSYKFKAQCNKCGYIYNKSITSVGKCLNCIEIKEKQDAALHGATWLKRLLGSKRLYNLDCGHSIIAQAFKVSNGLFECKQCIKENLDYCASLASAEILESDSKTSKCLCKLSCGCISEVRRDAIYRGRIYCKEHDQTYYNSPNGVYLIEIKCNGFSWLKVGMSLNLERRISEYKLHESATFCVLKYIKFNTGYSAIEFENGIHKKFSEFNLDNSLMRKHMKSGYSECYPINKKEDILNLLEEKSLIEDKEKGEAEIGR